MSDAKFLENIDFSDGEYSLYIRHKEFGEFMVLSEKGLKENKNILKVRFNFINYLPGEGDRNYGVMLFKDEKLIKNKIGGAFKSFKIGTLSNYAIPVKKQRIFGTKNKIQQKLDYIKNNKNTFITYQPNFVADNRVFRFRVYFPSIAVPVIRKKDSTGYERIITVNGIEIKQWEMGGEHIFEKKWTSLLENCIYNKANTISNFEISISKESLSDAYIFDTTQKGGEIKTPDNHILYLKDYMYYNFTAYIMSNKENAEKLLTLDYSDCLSEKDRNRPKVISKMKDLIRKSTKPTLDIDKGEVGLYFYKDEVKKYKELYEQDYTLRWLETKNE